MTDTKTSSNNDNNLVDSRFQNVPEKLDQNTALSILVNAVHVGQSRGAWKLEETEVLLRAIRAFVRPSTEESAENN